MSILKQNQLSEIDITESQWKNVYMLGGISAIIDLCTSSKNNGNDFCNTWWSLSSSLDDYVYY